MINGEQNRETLAELIRTKKEQSLTNKNCEALFF
jgi:hypothetical protein